MKIEQIEYRILFAHQENIRILFKYLKIFEYSYKFAKKCKGFGIQKFYVPQKHLLIRKNFPHVDSHQQKLQIYSLLTEYCPNFVFVSQKFKYFIYCFALYSTLWHLKIFSFLTWLWIYKKAKLSILMTLSNSKCL